VGGGKGFCMNMVYKVNSCRWISCFEFDIVTLKELDLCYD